MDAASGGVDPADYTPLETLFAALNDNQGNFTIDADLAGYMAQNIFKVDGSLSYFQDKSGIYKYERYKLIDGSLPLEFYSDTNDPAWYSEDTGNLTSLWYDDFVGFGERLFAHGGITVSDFTKTGSVYTLNAPIIDIEPGTDLDYMTITYEGGAGYHMDWSFTAPYWADTQQYSADITLGNTSVVLPEQLRLILPAGYAWITTIGTEEYVLYVAFVYKDGRLYQYMSATDLSELVFVVDAVYSISGNIIITPEGNFTFSFSDNYSTLTLYNPESDVSAVFTKTAVTLLPL